VIALSPGLSWLIFGSLIALVGFIYVYLVGSDWLDRSERELNRLAKANPSRTFVEPEDAHIRIVGGIYDAEVRGDFD